MQVYYYKALRKDESVQSGKLLADGIDALDRKLREQSLELIWYRKRRAAYFASRTVDRDAFIQFISHLEQMIAAGVPVVQSLVDLRDSQEDERFAGVLDELLSKVSSGMAFSEALSSSTTPVPSIAVTMARVGEQTGNFAGALKELHKALLWQKAIGERWRRAISYPLFSGLVLLAVSAFLMTYLVPNLVLFIQGAARELPWYTVWLLAVSNHLSRFFLIYLLAFFALFAVLTVIYRISEQFRFQWSRLVLQLVWLGPVMFQIKIARFTYFSSMMYAAGITVIDAFETSKSITTSPVLEASIETVIRKIRDGQSIGQSFSEAAMFPPFIARMLSVGEKTGALDHSLLQISNYYREEADKSIARFEQMIGPVLVMVIGALLVWVIIAVIGPIYDAVLSLEGQL
ncbi:MAG: type II secretion system F family protein [Gammaproteobacteria bacterium]|nr:type II secretion system F family protein [Gammaproteobacteria bacterium]